MDVKCLNCVVFCHGNSVSFEVLLKSSIQIGKVFTVQYFGQSTRARFYRFYHLCPIPNQHFEVEIETLLNDILICDMSLVS